MSDIFSDDDEVAQLKKLWNNYGIALVSAVVIAIVGILSWNFYQDYRSSNLQSAADLFAEYSTSRGLGEPTAVYLDALATDFGDTSYHVFALLYETKDAADASKYDEALELLDRAAEIAEGSALEPIVLLRKARVLFQLDRTDEAMKTVEQINSTSYLADAMELRGDLLHSQGKSEEARVAYNTALESLSEDVQGDSLKLKIALLRSN